MEAPVATAQPPDTSRWSLALLETLEWKHLQELCAGFLDCLGFTSQVQSVGLDGSTQMHVYLHGEKHPSLIAEFKPWKSRKVGLAQVQALVSASVRESVNEAVMITVRGYEAAARKFTAPGMELILIDGQEFLEAIALLPAREQSRLLEIATAGDFAMPTCPGCGAKMVQRKELMTENPFWSCPNFPRCKRILQDG